jgi:integrase
MADGIRGKICSCPRAKQSKCSHPYHFKWGQDYRFSVDVQAGRHIETKTEAEKLGRGWLQEIRDGVFVRRERGAPALTQTADSTALTLAGFAEVYLRDCSLLNLAGRELKDRKHADYYVFQPLLAFTLPDGRVLGELPFAAVDEGMYEQYVADRREQDYAASTVNKDVQLITAMCRWATRRGYFGAAKINPISGESRIIVRKDPARRHRRISDEELAALQPHSDVLLWAFIELALITCLRLTELYRLQWRDYQGLRLKVRPDATKVASAERWAPLDDRGVAILQYLRVNPAGKPYPDEDFIFGQCGEAPAAINDRLNTALLKAFPEHNEAGEAVGIQWVKGVHGTAARQRLDEINLVFGDLRHEGALRKYAKGWQLNELQLLLGHSNLVQTSTYLGIGNEAVMDAMARHGSGAKVIAPNVEGNPQGQSEAIRGGKPGPKRGSRYQVTH